MITKIKKITKVNFVKNVITVATGTAGAQIITMAFSPIITRIYTPEEYGLLGLYLAVVMMLAPIAALTYPIAIVLPEKSQNALSLVQLSFILSFAFGGLLTVILSFFGSEILNLINAVELVEYINLIPLTIILVAFLQVIEQYAIRNKGFKSIAKASVIRSVLVGSAQVGIGYLNPIGLVLILSATAGFYIKATLIYMHSSLNIKTLTKAFDLREVIGVAVEYKKFPIYRAPQVFINTLSQSMPVVFLAIISGPVASGYYTLAMSVLNVPVILLAKSVGDVFYPYIVEKNNKKESIENEVYKASFALALLGIIPFGAVFLFGEELFSLIFGDAWNTAGLYASWLSLWLYTMFFTTAVAKVIPVIDAQSFDLVFTVYKVLMRLLAILLSYGYYESAELAVVSYSVVGAIINIQFLVQVLLKIKKYER